MTERITTHLLVTLRHEKPIDKIADVVSCRLSMLEGVDGSGVDAVVVQPEFLDNGLKIEPEEAEALREAFKGDTQHQYERAIEKHGEAWNAQLGVLPPGNYELNLVDPLTMSYEVINKDNLSREQFENTARLLTKGMGENITP